MTPWHAGKTLDKEKYPKWGFRDKKTQNKILRNNVLLRRGIFDPKKFHEQAVVGGYACTEKCRKSKRGIFSKHSQSKSQNTCKNNGIGIYSDEVKEKAQRARLLNRGCIFNGIPFASNQEREFAMNIHYQIEKLKYRKNCNVKVHFKYFDFLIKRYKCFIEFHPWDRRYSLSQYYIRRRQVLDLNGYKDYNLIVIK